MSEHTPGPWVGFSDEGRLFAIMPAGRDGDICTFKLPPSEADGRLMTAAPALLSALVKLSNEASGWLGYEPEMRQVAGNTNFACLRQRVEEARAILASTLGG